MQVYLTTAKRRQPTLERTLQSLAVAKIGPIVRPDPGRGAFRHWLTVAAEAAQNAPGIVAIFQDDILVPQGLGRALGAFKWPRSDWGCLSLYLSAKYAGYGTGWVEHWGCTVWGACALLFPSEVLSALINLPLAQHWKSKRGIDQFVGEGLEDLGLGIRFHSPSLVQHIGETSTVCDEPLGGWRVASDFVGEDFKDIIWP